MNKIFKYKLENVDKQTIELPLPARILSVMEQNDDIVLYSVVDDDESVPKIPVDVLIVGTGEIVEDNIGLYTFLGTVELFDCKEIWHVFYSYADHRRDGNSNIRESQFIIEEFDSLLHSKGGMSVS